MNKRKLGARYELEAVSYLKAQGYEILSQNFQCRQGEIDIIAKQEGCLCFVEVKYRENESKGNPLEAVTHTKQKRICRVSSYYMYRHGYGETTAVRYDVLGITKDRYTLVKNAYDYI